MIVNLDVLELNDYSDIQEIIDPGMSENVTLNGSMYIDYMYRRRSWKLTWSVIIKSTYNSIRAKYDRQFTTGQLTLLNIPSRSIYGQCYLNINTLDLKYDDQYIFDFVLTIDELGAIS